MSGWLKIFSRNTSQNRLIYHWRYIIIHHSLTKDQKVVDWPAIRKYHKEVLGWREIGYHFGVEGIYRPFVGQTYETLLGRQLNQTGAHCKQQGRNKDSMGIVLIGNFDLAPPPKEQLQKAIELVKALMDIFRIPKENVKRHSDFAPWKTCPGKAFPWDDFLKAL